MLVQTDLGPKKVGTKNVGLKRIDLGTNKFWFQKLGSTKSCGSTKMLGLQIDWVPKHLGPKTYWIQESYWSKKIGSQHFCFW